MTENTPEESYLLEGIAFGLADGLIMCLGLIIGVAEATSSTNLVIITGIIGGFANAFGNSIGFFMSQSAERALELSRDKEITSKDIRNKPGKLGEGVGIVEAARGTLIHHYKLDEEGLVKKFNLIVATTNNAPAICMSIRDAAKGLIHGPEVGEGLLNMVEMAFRAYDPCLACATHFAIGQMPLEVKIYDHNKELLNTVKR
jgi:hypothetical protein